MEVWYNKPVNKIELMFKILSVYTKPECKPALILGATNEQEIEDCLQYIKKLVIQGLDSIVEVRIYESLNIPLMKQLEPIAVNQPYLLRYIHVENIKKEVQEKD